MSFTSIKRFTHWFLEFSISSVYWHGAESPAAPAAPTEGDPAVLASPHLSLRELWLALAHSRRGGAGGRGRVDRRKEGLRGPEPMPFTAWERREN